MKATEETETEKIRKNFLEHRDVMTIPLEDTGSTFVLDVNKVLQNKNSNKQTILLSMSW